MSEINVKGSQQIAWMYPNLHGGSYGEGDRLRITLYHVRAANSIEIRYDSERDGWSVLMDGCDPEADPPQGIDEYGPPREVAFIPSWCPVRGSGLTP